MNKNTKTLLLVAGIGIAAYFLYRWYQSRQAASGGQGAVSQLGSNLNSMAPELVGGSSGPSSGPQVTMPVTISLTQPVTKNDIDSGDGGQEMESGPNTPAFSPQMSTATGGTASESPNALSDEAAA